MDIEQFLKDHDKKNYDLKDIEFDLDNDFWIIRTQSQEKDSAILSHYNKIRDFINKHSDREVLVNKHKEDFITDPNNGKTYYRMITRLILLDKE